MPYIGNVSSSFNVGTANIDNGAVTGDKLSTPFDYDSGTLYLDNTNNRVGIGTTSPVRLLNLSGNNSGEAALLRLQNLQASGDLTTQAISIEGVLDYNNNASAAFAGKILFGKEGTYTTNISTINSYLSFSTVSSNVLNERLRIGSNGNITIAAGGNIVADLSNATLTSRTYFQTSSTNNFTVLGVIPNGTNVTSAFYAFNDSTPTNASYAGVAVTNVASVVRSAVVGTGTQLPLVFETNVQEQARFTTTDRYFRMAAGTGGIQFKGDTAATNALDDYEELSWTVNLYDAATGGNVSATSATGYYTKVGRLVTASFSIGNFSTAGMTAGGALHFSLPFASAASAVSTGSAMVGSTNLGANGIVPYVASSASRGSIYEYVSGAAWVQLAVVDFTSGAADLILTVTYNAAA